MHYGEKKRDLAARPHRVCHRLRFAGWAALLLAGMQSGVCAAPGDREMMTAYCPEAYLQHWDAIVFTLSTDKVSNRNGRPPLHGGTEYDVKILRGSDEVGDLRALVTEELNRLGYTVAGNPLSPEHIGELVNVHSSIICAVQRNIRYPDADHP